MNGFVILVENKNDKINLEVVCLTYLTEDEDEDEEEDDEEVKDRSQPRPIIWLDVESSREAAHWLPWRPDKSKGQSEEDCDDPDRQVVICWVFVSFDVDYCTEL